jgi:hypothetical protein
MAERPARKIYRVRRTIEPGASASHSLPRAVWGIAPGAARTALANQAQAFQAEAATVDQQIAAERARLAQLMAETDLQKRRLANLRNIVQVLREKLARERAARSVLAARLMDRQAEEQKMIQADTALRVEKARLGADTAQEHEALRQLVAALYRSVAGKAGIPADLTPVGQVPVEPAQPLVRQNLFRSRNQPDTTPKWHRFLQGKRADRRLTAADGHVVIEEGETVGPQNIADAEAAGLLVDLVLTVNVVEHIPDL